MAETVCACQQVLHTDSPLANSKVRAKAEHNSVFMVQFATILVLFCTVMYWNGTSSRLKMYFACDQEFTICHFVSHLGRNYGRSHNRLCGDLLSDALARRGAIASDAREFPPKTSRVRVAHALRLHRTCARVQRSRTLAASGMSGFQNGRNWTAHSRSFCARACRSHHNDRHSSLATYENPTR